MKYTNEHNGHTGDVQFFTVDSIPMDAKLVKNQPVAYGEKSGHIHVVTGDVELFEDSDGFYAKVGKGGSLSQHVHTSVFNPKMYRVAEKILKADHLPSQLLPNKIYKIGIHRKYDPFAKVWEKVID